MKKLLSLLSLLLALPATAQFKNAQTNAFPFTSTLNAGDVFIVGRPGVTNYNVAKSNLLSAIGGGGITPTNAPGAGSLVQAIVGGASPVYVARTNFYTFGNGRIFYGPRTIVIPLGDSITASTPYTNYNNGTSERWPLHLFKYFDAWKNVKGYYNAGHAGTGIEHTTNIFINTVTNAQLEVFQSILTYLTNTVSAGDDVVFPWQSSVNDASWYTNGGHPYIEVLSNAVVQLKSWSSRFNCNIYVAVSTPTTHLLWANTTDDGLLSAFVNVNNFILQPIPWWVADTNSVVTNMIDFPINGGRVLAANEDQRLFNSRFGTNFDGTHPFWSGEYVLANAFDQGIRFGREPLPEWDFISYTNHYWFNPSNGAKILDLKMSGFFKTLRAGKEGVVGLGNIAGYFKAINVNSSMRIDAGVGTTTEEMFGLYDDSSNPLWKTYADGTITAQGARLSTFGANQSVVLNSVGNTRPYVQLHDTANGNWMMTMQSGGTLAFTNSADILTLNSNGSVTIPNGGLKVTTGGITNGTPFWKTDTGSPESSIVAPIGSIYSRTDGSTDTALYRKETGTGNTGWVAVSAGGGGYSLSTNSFSGPTNALNMALSDQFYSTTTAVYLTNVLNWYQTNSQFAKLTVSNASASTVEFRIPSDWRTDDGLRVYYITNAQVRDVWVNCKNSMTNCVTTSLY